MIDSALSGYLSTPMSCALDQPAAQRHIQAELDQALWDLGLADDASGDTGHGNRATLDPLPPGTTIDRFSVLERIGRGGQGDVYAVYDPKLDRRVALKLIRPGHGPVLDVQNSRLMREAQALARFTHPNVIRVYEAGTHGTAAFLVMEYKTSRSLTRWLAEQRRSWPAIVEKFRAAGRGLQAAHEKGIVHRDIKADNIFVDDHEGAVLGDFGLAFESDDNAPSDESNRTLSEPRSPSVLLQPLTDTGQFPGTEGYIAPEALSGRATARSDQYSFCVALFHTLFGVLARPDEQRSPLRAGDSPPPSLVKALHRGLARDPAARFPDINSLLEALDARSNRRRFAVAALLTALLAGGGLAWAQTPSPCVVAARTTAESTWNPARRAAIASAFAAVNLPFAYQTGQSFLRFADDYSAQWVSARTEACAAPSAATETCLVHGLERFDRLLTTYAAPDDPLVLHALDATASLDAPSACRDPGTPIRGDIPDELRRELDQTDLRIASGDFAGAGRSVVALQRVPSDSPAHPRVLYLAGWLAGATTPDRRSDTLLADAMHAAARIRDYDTFARAATYRLKSVVLDLGEPAEAAALDPWIESFAAQWTRGTVADRQFRAELAEARGIRLDREGDSAAAIEQHRDALAQRTKLVGRDHPLVAKSHHNFAVSLAYVGDYDAARTNYLEALRIRREQLGDTHPQTLETTFGLAQAECEHFDALSGNDPAILSDCVEELKAALDEYRQNPLLDPRGRLRRATTLANHAIDAGRDDLAEAALAAADASIADLSDVDLRERSDLLLMRGKLETSRQSYTAALVLFTVGTARDDIAIASLLARSAVLIDAPCSARMDYANSLDNLAAILPPDPRPDDLQHAAATARRGCD